MDLGQSDALKLPTDVGTQRFARGHDPQLAAGDVFHWDGQ